MSITDELRKWGYGFCGDTHDVVTAIADRIDAEHEEATSEFWQKINAVPVTDENMAENGWVRLPKDADGEYIHIGDVMVYADGNTYPMKVVALVPPSVFLTDDGPRYADMCRHKPTTVEDMLYAFLEDWRASTMADGDDIIAKYATKLQLKEDA